MHCIIQFLLREKSSKQTGHSVAASESGAVVWLSVIFFFPRLVVWNREIVTKKPNGRPKDRRGRGSCANR